MNASKAEDISIVITAHREGSLARYSIESLLNAAKELDKEKISYKFYVNVDNGNRATMDFFESYKERGVCIDIWQSSFSDPGSSRNSIVAKTTGKFLMIIDADDAISRNWLIDSYRKIKCARKPILVHPEVEIRYSDKKLWSVDIRTDLESIWADNLALIFGNRWCSIMMGRREIFLNSNYSVNGKGFGYEDYFFNCETLCKGVRHLVVRDTVAFCLMKEESTNRKAVINHEVLPYTELFDLKKLKWKKFLFGLPKIGDRHKMVGLKKSVFEFSKEFDKINTGFLGVVKKDMENLKVDIGCAYEYLKYGSIYCEMVKMVKAEDCPREVFFVNNVVDYLESPKHRVDDIYIILGDSGSISPKKNVIFFGSCLSGQSCFVKEELLTRLIVQLRTKSINKCSNSLIDKWILEHGVLIKENSIKVSVV